MAHDHTDLPMVFTAAQGLAAGLSVGVLRGPKYTQVLRGVYARAEDSHHPDVVLHAALVAAGGRAQLCEATGLRLRGVAIPDVCEKDTDIHVLAHRTDRHTETPGIRVHRTPSMPEAQVLRDLRCAPASLCWLQLAAHPGVTLDDLVITADSLMRWQDPVLFESDLAEEIAAHPHTPGVRLVRQALTLARSGTDSVAETVLRLRIVRAGLPCPVVNHSVTAPNGHPRYRLDLAYPEVHLGVEYDGAGHVGDRDQMESDRIRRRNLEDWGWRLITVTSRDMRDAQQSYLTSIRHALASASSDRR